MTEFVKLKSVESGHGQVKMSYSSFSNNGTTTLEQTMEVERNGYGEWIAKMKMDDFPPQKNASGAVLNLADWMERMSKAIRTGIYDVIFPNTL